MYQLIVLWVFWLIVYVFASYTKFNELKEEFQSSWKNVTMKIYIRKLMSFLNIMVSLLMSELIFWYILYMIAVDSNQLDTLFDNQTIIMWLFLLAMWLKTVVWYFFIKNIRWELLVDEKVAMKEFQRSMGMAIWVTAMIEIIWVMWLVYWFQLLNFVSN